MGLGKCRLECKYRGHGFTRGSRGRAELSSGSHAATLFLRRKAATHDSEIRHLYEEMEAQIRNEKERLLLKVSSLTFDPPPPSLAPLTSSHLRRSGL